MLSKSLLDHLPGLLIGSVLSLAGSYIVIISDRTNLVSQRHYEQAFDIVNNAEDVAIGAEELVYELTRSREKSEPPYAFNDPEFLRMWHVWRLKAQSIRGRSALVFKEDPAMYFIDDTVVDKITVAKRPQSIVEIQIHPDTYAKTIDQKITFIWRTSIIQRDVSRWISEEEAALKEKNQNEFFPKSKNLTELNELQESLNSHISEATNNISESNQKILLQYNVSLSEFRQN